MSEIEFWKWVESEVERQLSDPRNPFLILHPASIRTKASAVFNLKNHIEVCEWQKANLVALTKAFRRAGKRVGMRLLPSSVVRSYTTFTRIAQPSNPLLGPSR